MTTKLLRIAHLGSKGTFTEEAALSYIQDKPNSNLIMYPDVTASVEAVVQGDADAAIVPYDNTLGGRVDETHNALFHNTDLRIYNELFLRTEYCLIAPKSFKDISRIHIVAGHPQALSQCQGYLKRQLPDAHYQKTLSAAQAVIIANNKVLAAVAPRRVAEMYNAHIAETDIQDQHNSFTRFVVLHRKLDHELTGNDKTTIICSAPNTTGTLLKIVQCFTEQSINLLRIESFSSENDSNTFFTIDCEGHRADSHVAKTIHQLSQKTLYLRVIGSYPQSPPW